MTPGEPVRWSRGGDQRASAGAATYVAREEFLENAFGMTLALPNHMTQHVVHGSAGRVARRATRAGASLGVLLIPLLASGCLRPLTRRLDVVTAQLVVTNEQLAQTNRELLQMRALLESADRQLATMERLLVSTDSGMVRTNAQLSVTNEQLVQLRAQIRALLGRIPDVRPGP